MANKSKDVIRDTKKKKGTNKKAHAKTAYQRERDAYKSSTRSYKRACRENMKVVPKYL